MYNLHATKYFSSIFWHADDPSNQNILVPTFHISRHEIKNLAVLFISEKNYLVKQVFWAANLMLSSGMLYISLLTTQCSVLDGDNGSNLDVADCD